MVTPDRTPLWAYSLGVLTYLTAWTVYLFACRWVHVTVRRAKARRHVAPVIPLRERSRT